MSLRVCSVPGCPKLTPKGKCEAHRQADRRARLAAEAGMGRPHRRRKAELLAAALNTPCPICRRIMRPGGAWPVELDHSTPRALGNREVGDRIVCRSCNASAGGRLGWELRR
jgi:hypothetical protein